ncbi:MAG: ATPase [Mycobacterium sp.]|nr:ATPase [Mycobacterium sp.]
MNGVGRRRDGRVDIRAAHGGGVRRARPDAEVGRATVSYENVVGLVLSVILALFLGCALLFPERF